MKDASHHDIPEPYSAPHVHAGQDFQTKITVQMEYLVREMERQGKILGNGTGMISDVRWMKDWIRARMWAERVILATLLGAGALWLCKVIWKAASL